MSIIKELTKECTREDCSLVQGHGLSTCMYFPITYDKEGNVTSKDYNTHTSSYTCRSCKDKWWVSQCAGEITVTKENNNGTSPQESPT